MAEPQKARLVVNNANDDGESDIYTVTHTSDDLQSDLEACLLDEWAVRTHNYGSGVFWSDIGTVRQDILNRHNILSVEDDEMERLSVQGDRILFDLDDLDEEDENDA